MEGGGAEGDGREGEGSAGRGCRGAEGAALTRAGTSRQPGRPRGAAGGGGPSVLIATPAAESALRAGRAQRQDPALEPGAWRPRPSAGSGSSSSSGYTGARSWGTRAPPAARERRPRRPAPGEGGAGRAPAGRAASADLPESGEGRSHGAGNRRATPGKVPGWGDRGAPAGVEGAPSRGRRGRGRRTRLEAGSARFYPGWVAEVRGGGGGWVDGRGAPPLPWGADGRAVDRLDDPSPPRHLPGQRFSASHQGHFQSTASRPVGPPGPSEAPTPVPAGRILRPFPTASPQPLEKQRRAGGCPDPEKRYRSSNFPQPRSPSPPPTLPSRPQSSGPPSRLRSAESPGPREDPVLGGAFLGRMGRGLERGDRVGRGPQISGARGGGGSRCSFRFVPKGASQKQYWVWWTQTVLF